VYGAACITFVPVSKYCPLDAKVIPVNSDLAPSPLNILIGYNIETFEPKEPETHSIAPFLSTTHLLVFKLYIFFDQFSIVLYLSLASSFTNNSPHPACRLFTLYLGAEQPSMKWR